jgi:hypothetical protein
VISKAYSAHDSRSKVFLDLSPSLGINLGGTGAFFAQFMPQSYSSSDFVEKFLENPLYAPAVKMNHKKLQKVNKE